MSKKEFKKVKVREFTYEDFLNIFNKNDNEATLKSLLNRMDRMDRVRVAVDYIKDTKFKSYKIAMRNFVVLMDRYFEFKDKDQLTTYASNLVDDHTEPLYNTFIEVRRLLVNDLIKDDAGSTSEAVYLTLATLNDGVDEKYDQQLKEFILDAAAVKWEQAKTLKVLHGRSDAKV